MQVESELRELEAEEAAEYLESLGASEGGFGSLIRATYQQLGLKTYFTSGPTETRAWTIKSGMTAPQAAGVIHTDFERGFIRAETVACGSAHTGVLAVTSGHDLAHLSTVPSNVPSPHAEHSNIGSVTWCRYDDFVTAEGMSGAKENGRVRQEGKEYVVQEGDIMLFKFNV